MSGESVGGLNVSEVEVQNTLRTIN